MSFETLGLSDKVLAAVTAAGYTEPTPIQSQAIPPALQGRDILGIAQTGTGKTAAFVLPMLSRLETGRARARMPRTLILEPTRELAAQVAESFEKYGVNHKLNVALLIGGVAFGDQEKKIMRGADVLIATPGRMIDFYERGKLLMTGIDVLVIDEADRMLDMGFIPDIEKICKLVPFTRQTLFFSATMPPEITRLTEQFLQNPLRIEVARLGSTADTITQTLVASHSGHEKRETLRKVIRGAQDFRNAIIFANRKRDVAILNKSLTKHGFNAGELHGDMDQKSRMASLEAFKNGDVSLLVCSDVAARGLDIPDVSHVFNFDVPYHPDDYVHRIGRTGRAGKTGSATTICTAEDEKYITAIQDLINIKLDWDGPGFSDLPPAEPDPYARRRGNRERSSKPRRNPRGAPRPIAPRSGPDAATTPYEHSSEPADVSTGDVKAPAKRARRPRRDSKNKENTAPVSADANAEKSARPATGRRRNPAEEAATSKPKRQPRKSSRNENRDDGPSVKGLGDHVPAFLTRPVPSRSTKKKEALAEE